MSPETLLKKAQPTMFTTYKNVDSRAATIATNDEALAKSAAKLTASWGLSEAEGRAYFLRLGVNRAMTLVRDRARRATLKKGKTPRALPRLVPAKTPDEVNAMIETLVAEWADFAGEGGESMGKSEARAYCVRMGINRAVTLRRFPKAEAATVKKAAKKAPKKAAKKAPKKAAKRAKAKGSKAKAAPVLNGAAQA